MNDKDKMLESYAAAQFAAHEMNLFLDTHKEDKKAFELYKKYLDNAMKLRREYEAKFGPLTVKDLYDSAAYDWTKAPWPWDKCKGDN